MSKLLCVLTFLIFSIQLALSQQSYAFVVASSNGYYNYRHQSNSHAVYQLLLKNGMHQNNIITMFYDDIASDKLNPFPGQVFNQPTYTSKVNPIDVYAGVHKDYTGDDVSAANFLNILVGNATAMAGIGSGRVLNATSQDHVFVYLSDHGANNLVVFTDKDYLYSTDLSRALKYMNSQGQYGKLTFFIESCESGSMFEKDLPDNIHVYAMTASMPDQDHYATYCPDLDDLINGTHIGACLSGEFSASFLNSSYTYGPNQSLRNQYQYTVKHVEDSVPQQYGDLSFQDMRVGDFLGAPSKFGLPSKFSLPSEPSYIKEYAVYNGFNIRESPSHMLNRWNEWDARFFSIQWMSNFYHDNDMYSHLLQDEIKIRHTIDRIAGRILELLYEKQYEQVSLNETDENSEVMNCYFNIMTLFHTKCGRKNEYALSYGKKFKKLCATTSDPISTTNTAVKLMSECDL